MCPHADRNRLDALPAAYLLLLKLESLPSGCRKHIKLSPYKRLFAYFHNLSNWIPSLSATPTPTRQLMIRSSVVEKIVMVLILLISCWLFRKQRNRKPPNKFSVNLFAPPRQGILMKPLQPQKHYSPGRTFICVSPTLYIMYLSCCCTGKAPHCSSTTFD